MAKMIKSPLRYPGGKSKAITMLQKYIPTYKELREPFFGGGSFSIYCAQMFRDKPIKASDLNYELFCFWNELKRNKDKLYIEIKKIFESDIMGRDLYNSIIEVNRSIKI